MIDINTPSHAMSCTLSIRIRWPDETAEYNFPEVFCSGLFCDMIHDRKYLQNFILRIYIMYLLASYNFFQLFFRAELLADDTIVHVVKYLLRMPFIEVENI